MLQVIGVLKTAHCPMTMSFFLNQNKKLSFKDKTMASGIYDVITFNFIMFIIIESVSHMM